LKGNYGIKENPLPWLDWVISADNVTNFFEQRVADYSAGGMTGEWGWAE
jgi:ribonucleoside-diphosphate reductase beta chain